MPPRTREQAERSLGAYQRPAINFNQRDDMRDFARSGIGQNYNRMMDIQRQLPNMDRSNPMVQEFKDRRRTFNRYGKNPMGEMLGYTPQQMQDQYMDLSRDVRQTNKPVYNKMYPLTGGFMDVAEKGGILGSILSEIGNMSRDKGLPSMVDDSEEEVANYVNNTFRPNMADVAGPSTDKTFQGVDQYMAPPDDIIQTDPSADITVTNLPIDPRPTPNILDPDYLMYDHRYGDKYNPDGTPIDDTVTTIPGRPITPLQEEVVVPEEPLPFNDNLREAGIASMMGQGPQYDLGNRVYEDEFRDFTSRMGDMPGGPMTYEEFVEAYKRGILPILQGRR